MAFEPIDYFNPAVGGNAGSREELEPRERLALDLLAGATSAAGGTVVDIGCGRGRFLAALDARHSLTGRGWSLYGVDFSHAQITAASERLPYAFAQLNIENGVPYETGSISVIYAGEVIEHLYNPDAFLDECFRVLRSGGTAVFTTPNLHAWYNRMLFAAGIQPMFYETSTRSTLIGAGEARRIKTGAPPVGHIRLMHSAAIRDLLTAAGFARITLQGCAFVGFARGLARLDTLISRRPSLASILVAVAVKPG